jgi:predicted RNase H-like HicB family nuclease
MRRPKSNLKAEDGIIFHFPFAIAGIQDCMRRPKRRQVGALQGGEWRPIVLPANTRRHSGAGISEKETSGHWTMPAARIGGKKRFADNDDWRLCKVLSSGIGAIMTELTLTAVYEEAEEGGYIGYVAELPGANTQGETIEEVRENLSEAIQLILEANREEFERRLTPSAKVTR